MKYGQLRVTVVYNPDYTAVFNYHVWSWQEEGKWLSMTKDLTSVDNAVNTYFDVDVCANPAAVYGDADNITFEWPTPVSTAYNGIEHGDNLDDYTEPGVYCRLGSASNNNVVTNCPPTMYTSTFTLEVQRAGGQGQLVQRATRCHKTAQIVAQRFFYSGAWGEWQTISVNGQKVLWSGVSQMLASHTANLNDLITNQCNGVTLVFSAFADGEAKDTTWQFYDVPKHFVQNHAGQGVSVVLGNSCLDKMGTKYIWIHNDKIVGSEHNDNVGTSLSGIVYDNTFFVLRYVLGC